MPSVGFFCQNIGDTDTFVYNFFIEWARYHHFQTAVDICHCVRPFTSSRQINWKI